MNLAICVLMSLQGHMFVRLESPFRPLLALSSSCPPAHLKCTPARPAITLAHPCDLFHLSSRCPPLPTLRVLNPEIALILKHPVSRMWENTHLEITWPCLPICHWRPRKVGESVRRVWVIRGMNDRFCFIAVFSSWRHRTLLRTLLRVPT